MHILVIPSWYPKFEGDIVGSFFREQAQFLSDAGHQVGVLASSLSSLRNIPNAFGRLYGAEAFYDGDVFTILSIRPNFFPRMLRLNAHLISRDVLRSYEEYERKFGAPDIIHLHAAINSGIGATRLKSSTGKPLVYSEHHSALLSLIPRKGGRRIISRVVESADLCSVVSPGFGLAISERFDIAKRNWIDIPNPVNPIFLSHPFAESTRETFKFLHISNLTKNKNVELILRSFAKAFGGISSIELHIGGNGPELKNLLKLAEEINIEKQTKFIGAMTRPEVAKNMIDADAFLMSSKVETFGVVIIEALATGMPVISTPTMGPASIITDETGITTKGYDVDEYSSAMVEMYREIDRWPRAHLREVCRCRFSSEIVTKQWVNVYKRLLNSN